MYLIPVILASTFRRGLVTRPSVKSESSFAPREDERKSVSRGVAFYEKAAMYWFSRTQPCVSLPSSQM